MQPATASPVWSWRRCDRVLLLLLVASMASRVWLAVRGGQTFWGDETRYDASLEAAKSLRAGAWGDAIDAIFLKADHMGYKLAMVPIAWVQLQFRLGNAFPAVLGSGLFATCNIAWVFALARRMGGSVAEARWSALLMAMSASMFYWSRHLMPYDMALCWGLACLYAGLHPAPTWWHSLLAGALGFLGFVTYNGAWLFVALALVGHVLLGWPSWRQLLVRSSLGLAGLIGCLALLGLWTGAVGLNLIEAYLGFAGTINQGNFDEGARVIWAYLWEAEHGFLVFWLLCMGYFSMVAWRERPRGPLLRPCLWLVGIAGYVAGLVLFANGLEKFVVYGRLVRPLVPLLSLLGGWSLARIAGPDLARAWMGTVAAAAIVALGAGNFWRPILQQFPNDFYLRGQAVINSSLVNSRDEEDRLRIRGQFKFTYLGFIWPVPVTETLPPHVVLLETPHPLQYEPYLYEGFNREQRRAFHETDIRMQLIRIKD